MSGDVLIPDYDEPCNH